jgi:hypothetical protein
VVHLYNQIHCFVTSYWAIMLILKAWKSWSWVDLDNELWCLRVVIFSLSHLGGHCHFLVKCCHAWEKLYYQVGLMGLTCPYPL